MPKNSTSTILQSFDIWSKLKRWKSLISGCLVSWSQIEKIIILKYHLLLFYAATTNHFSIGLWRAMISGFYMITSNNQLSVWMENKLQSTSQCQTCAKKRSWSLFGGLISYSFLSPGEAVTSEKYAQQIDELHGKLQGLQPALINRKGPFLLQDKIQLHVVQPTLQKLNNLDYEVFPHPPHSPDLTPTNYHFFKHLDNFLQGKCFHNQRRQKMLSKSLSNPKALIFMLQQ